MILIDTNSLSSDTRYVNGLLTATLFDVDGLSTATLFDVNGLLNDTP